MKSLKSIERKYYKKVPWTQPTLTENGVFGGDKMAVYADWYGGTSSDLSAPYKAFLPNTSGNVAIYGNEFMTKMLINVYIPIPIILTNFCFSALYAGDASSGAYNVHLWGGNSKNSRELLFGYAAYIPENFPFEFNLLQNTLAYQYFTLEAQTGGAGKEDYLVLKNFLLKGYGIQESTESDYDFYRDFNSCDLFTKTERKYYKYNDTSWTQPVLTSNGVLGGDNFAVTGQYYSSQYPYLAFDSSSSTYWETFNYAQVDTCCVYNPNPLNISDIVLSLRDNKGWTSITISGRNDGTDYMEEQTISAVNDSVAGTDTFACSFEGYYKYYKITYTNRFTSSGGYYAQIYNIALTATQRIITEGTESDYDAYEDVKKYYAARI